MPPNPRVKLTKDQASEMQDMLIAGYQTEAFQKELHAIWYITDDPMKRMKMRQELCLTIQGPIIVKFGFEANRKGVAQSVMAFNEPDIAWDQELQAKNAILGTLVNPDLQEGKADAKDATWVNQGWKPPAERAEKKPSAKTPKAKPAARAPKEAMPAPPQQRPARDPMYQSPIPLEEAFLLRFKLGPPGGFQHYKMPEAVSFGPKELTRDAALAMLDDLIAGYAKEDFQMRLRQAINSAKDNAAKARARQKVTMEVQIPIISQYGFEASFNGVLQSAAAFTEELNKDKLVAQKNALVFWLIDPVAQAWTPVPSGPARIMLSTTISVHRADGRGKLCSFTTDLAGNFRSVKETIQAQTGTVWQAQQLFLGDTELDDWSLLHTITHVGGRVDLRLSSRRQEVVDWLVQAGDSPEAVAKAPKALLSDYEFIWPAIQQQVKVLAYAPPEIQANRDLLLKVVCHCGQAIQYAHPSLRQDREVVLHAVRQDGWALQHAAPSLQADREIVLNAVWQDGWALQFAATWLRGDRDIVMTAAAKDAWVIGSAAPELQADRLVVLAAVRQDWRVLETVQPAMRGDKEIILAAVKQDGWALEFASQELCADREVVLEAAKRAGECLRFADKRLCADREIAFAAVKNCGVALALIAPDVQDLEMVLTAVRNDPRSLPFVAPHLVDDVKKTLGFHSLPSWAERPSGAGPGVGPGSGGVQRWVLPNLKKHFDVLRLAESATPQEIKKAYRKLALLNHPDKHPEDPEKAKKVFQQINNAYQAIKEALNL